MSWIKISSLILWCGPDTSGPIWEWLLWLFLSTYWVKRDIFLHSIKVHLQLLFTILSIYHIRSERGQEEKGPWNGKKPSSWQPCHARYTPRQLIMTVSRAKCHLQLQKELLLNVLLTCYVCYSITKMLYTYSVYLLPALCKKNVSQLYF